MLRRLWQQPRCELAPDLRRGESPLPVYLLLLFFTVSYFAQLGARLSLLSAIRHELLLGMLMLFLSGLFLMLKPIPLRPNGPILLGVGLLFVALVAQIPLAPAPDHARDVFFDSVFKHAIYCLFVIALARSPRQILGVVGAWLFSMFWVYQESVRGLITGSLMWRNQGILRLHGSVEMYRNSNGLSLAACSSVPFIYQFLPVLKRPVALRLFLLATFACAALCILYTGSRAGYVGFVSLVPYWVLTRRNKVRNIAIMIAVLAVAVVVMPQEYRDRFASITAEEGEEGTGSRHARIQLMVDAWQVFQRYPLGVGIDGFPVVRAQMFGRDQDVHNLYLQILTHIGIQGFLVWAFFVVTVWRSLSGSMRRLRDLRRLVRGVAGSRDDGFRRRAAAYDHQLVLLNAVAAAARMYLFFMLVNGVFAHTLYHVSWWYITGLAVSVGHVSQRLLDEGRRRAGLIAASEPQAEPQTVPV